eukprot:6802274-Karenia_brevis.AAC.1
MQPITDQTDMKGLSVRKLVRVIYEHFGTQKEEETRKKVTRNYPKGIVRYDGDHVGEWEDG